MPDDHAGIDFEARFDASPDPDTGRPWALPYRVEGRLWLRILELLENPRFGERDQGDALDSLRCDQWRELPAADRMAVVKMLQRAGYDRDLLTVNLGALDRRSGAWTNPPEAPPAPADDGPPWASLDTIAASEPTWTPAADGLMFPGRVVCLAGAAKAGKTSALAAAAAGVAYGSDWLTGEIRDPGAVLWLGAPGESMADEVRHLMVRAGLPPERENLGRVHFSPVRRLAGTLDALQRWPIDGLRAVVVDSLRGLLTAEGADENDSGAVRAVLGRLAELAADGVAVDVLHHFRRDPDAPRGERVRGSGDILAGVDLTVEFERTGEGARLSYSGRLGGPAADRFLAWSDGRYSEGRAPSVAKAEALTEVVSGYREQGLSQRAAKAQARADGHQFRNGDFVAEWQRQGAVPDVGDRLGPAGPLGAVPGPHYVVGTGTDPTVPEAVPDQAKEDRVFDPTKAFYRPVRRDERARAES